MCRYHLCSLQTMHGASLAASQFIWYSVNTAPIQNKRIITRRVTDRCSLCGLTKAIVKFKRLRETSRRPETLKTKGSTYLSGLGVITHYTYTYMSQFTQEGMFFLLLLYKFTSKIGYYKQTLYKLIRSTLWICYVPAAYMIAILRKATCGRNVKWW